MRIKKNKINWFVTAVLLVLGISLSHSQTCTASFTMSQGANGVVNFTSNTNVTNTLGAQYFWNYGDGSPTFSAFGAAGRYPTHTYTVNGPYTVVATVTSFTPACTNNASALVTVTTVTNCPLVAGFTYTMLNNGQVNFSNTTSGTVSGVSYSWNFGNSQTSTVTSPAVIYTVNNTYTVTLTASNNSVPTCTNQVSVPINVTTACGLIVGITYTYFPNGTVLFSTASSNTALGYSWNFGNGGTSTLQSPIASYTANANYTVLLQATTSNTPICSNTFSAVVSITNAVTCSISADFTTSSISDGTVNFANTTTGTLSGVSYSWNFGNGNTSNLVSPSTIYTTSGTYTVTLIAINNSIPNCSNTISKAITVTVCNLAPSFVYTVGFNGQVTFSNTSVGTTSSTTYTWSLGHAGNTSNTIHPFYTYPNGNYTVVLSAFNYSGCSGATSQVISVSNSTCALNALFTHTVGQNGQVAFSSVSSGTTLASLYNWNFGDGALSTAVNPQHTYISSGVYYVSLLVSESNNPLCSNSNTFALNVTGISCHASAQFSVTPTSTPQAWNLTPSFPWNISNVLWSWGDNTTSPVLYTSHVYSASGLYNICMNVTVSCGATASACASYSLSKGVQGFVYVNVVPPLPWVEITGVNETTDPENNITVFPNPNNGKFSISGLFKKDDDQVNVILYSFSGQKVLEKNLSPDQDNANIVFDVSELPPGIYSLCLFSNARTVFSKLVIRND